MTSTTAKPDAVIQMAASTTASVAPARGIVRPLATLKARHFATMEWIAAHHDRWEITGPPEIRTAGAEMFNLKSAQRPADHLPPDEKDPPPDHGPTPDPPPVEQPPPIDDSLERGPRATVAASLCDGVRPTPQIRCDERGGALAPKYSRKRLIADVRF